MRARAHARARRQVGDVLTGLANTHGLFVVFTGGTPYLPQQRALQGHRHSGGHARPDHRHLNNGDLDLTKLRICVLDEADEMLNMGFKDDVETILEGSSNPETRDMSIDRQTVLFSATHPSWVRQVSAEYQTNVATLDAVGKGNSEAASTVEHRAVLTPGTDTARCSTLADIIAVYGTDQSRTIVFTSTRRECDELCASAPLSAHSPQALHGDVSQNQRDVTLKRFREGHFSVLVATDVAARGIDISGVDLIVQYRMPQDPDSYVHRSGRTGRAGRNGVSLLLYSEREQHEVRRLEQRANVRFLRDGPPSTTTVMEAACRVVPRRLTAVQPKVSEYFEDAAKEILASDDALEQVSRALALVAGKVTLTERSLLTGEDSMTTLQLEATDGTVLSPGDAMSAISAIAPGGVGGTERLADHVGKIRACQDPTKIVFDLPAAMADELIAIADAFDPNTFSGKHGLLQSGKLAFTQCIEPARNEGRDADADAAAGAATAEVAGAAAATAVVAAAVAAVAAAAAAAVAAAIAAVAAATAAGGGGGGRYDRSSSYGARVASAVTPVVGTGPRRWPAVGAEGEDAAVAAGRVMATKRTGHRVPTRAGGRRISQI